MTKITSENINNIAMYNLVIQEKNGIVAIASSSL